MCHGIRNNKRCDIEITEKEFYCNDHIHQRNEKKYFIKIVQILLDEFDKIIGKNDKFEKACNLFNFLAYNKKLVNSMREKFNKAVNDKITALLNDSFILENPDRFSMIEQYRKYFVWGDLEEIDLDQIFNVKIPEYPNLDIEINEIIL